MIYGRGREEVKDGIIRGGRKEGRKGGDRREGRKRKKREKGREGKLYCQVEG